MLIKILLCFVLSFILFAYGRDIVVKLDPKQLIDTIVSETSVKYLTRLAQVFAKTAAESFINEIKHKENFLDDTKRAKSVTKGTVDKHPMPDKKSIISVEDVLNEEEAYKLLEKPSPDGDNLGWHSGDDVFKDEDSMGAMKSTPAYGLMKVNGIYVRRLLDLGLV